MERSHGMPLYEHICICICFHNKFISTDVGSGPLRAERRRREARREIFTTPGHVTARRSILGPPAEGRPGPSDYNDDDDNDVVMSLSRAVADPPIFIIITRMIMMILHIR